MSIAVDMYILLHHAFEEKGIEELWITQTCPRHIARPVDTWGIRSQLSSRAGSVRLLLGNLTESARVCEPI